MTDAGPWWTAADDAIASRIFDYVQEVERRQSSLFERFFQLSAIYDPHLARLASTSGLTKEGIGTDDRGAVIHENVVASNVDTVTAIVAAQKVRPRQLLDDADWTTQRRARHLSWYAELLGKRCGIHAEAVRGFREGALKGTGLVKVFPDHLCGEVRVERVLVDDIVVDEGETRGGGNPRQMHQRVFATRDELRAQFPEAEHQRAIDGAQGGDSGPWRSWAGYRPIEQDHIVVVESWRLPIGRKGRKGYAPGKHTICIDSHCLLAEDYDRDRFPFAVFRWSDRVAGWYGIGGAERITGHHRRVNKGHWQADRSIDQHAMPTTWVHIADANLQVKTNRRLGHFGIYKRDMPKTVIPPAVSPEVSMRIERAREGSYEEFGVSRMTATAKKPAGLDSGAALREYRDQTTQRFALQEERFEQFVLDIYVLALGAAKELGTDAPVLSKKLARGRKKIHWPDVDMAEVAVQLEAASTLSRTPAGRTQIVLEWAQSGIISLDEARRMLAPFDPMDLDRTTSLYTAAIDHVDLAIEQMLDGEAVIPEPYENLKLGVWRVQQSYLRASADEAPEEVLELLRQWIVQAAYVMSAAQAPALGAPGGAPGAHPPPELQGGAPMGAPQQQLAANLIPQ